MEFRSSETADLFMVLIMYRLKRDGRAAVIVPDGFLFGMDGAKLAIKQKMLREFNLHTIIRLPGSIFSPYTSIATNILFFNNERADGAEEGFSTDKTWFYRLDMPEGYKHFSKTKSMRLEHCLPIARKSLPMSWERSPAASLPKNCSTWIATSTSASSPRKRKRYFPLPNSLPTTSRSAKLSTMR
mgnify:CR=1 FL=1